MVKIEILKEANDRLQLLLSETDRSFANALRRSLISDTPKMAIDSVRFQLGTKEQDDEVSLTLSAVKTTLWDRWVAFMVKQSVEEYSRSHV